MIGVADVGGARRLLFGIVAVMLMMPGSAAFAAPAERSRAQLVDRMLAAISAKDLPALQADIADNATMRLQFAPDAPAVLTGKDVISGYFKAFFGLYTAISIAEIVKTPAADGKTMTIESKGTFITAKGDQHSVGYVWVIATAHGKITASRAYILPLPAVVGK
jgi:ketosteroid isomerase-like protein